MLSSKFSYFSNQYFQRYLFSEVHLDIMISPLEFPTLDIATSCRPWKKFRFSNIQLNFDKFFLYKHEFKNKNISTEKVLIYLLYPLSLQNMTLYNFLCFVVLIAVFPTIHASYFKVFSLLCSIVTVSVKFSMPSFFIICIRNVSCLFLVLIISVFLFLVSLIVSPFFCKNPFLRLQVISSPGMRFPSIDCNIE